MNNYFAFFIVLAVLVDFVVFVVFLVPFDIFNWFNKFFPLVYNSFHSTKSSFQLVKRFFLSAAVLFFFFAVVNVSFHFLTPGSDELAYSLTSSNNEDPQFQSKPLHFHNNAHTPEAEDLHVFDVLAEPEDTFTTFLVVAIIKY